MLYDVNHRTKYLYESVVSQSSHLLHLTPRFMSRQVVHRHSILIDPAPSTCIEQIDYFGNPSSIVTIEHDHDRVNFLATSRIELSELPDLDLDSSPGWEQTVRLAQLESESDKHFSNIAQYSCYSSHTVATLEIADYAKQSFPPGRPFLRAVEELTDRIYGDFTYDAEATEVGTGLSEVMEMKRGVCQDYTHFALACLRYLELPSRYVSGYLLTHSNAGETELIGSNASHAWFSIWTPEKGWIDFDPTNNVIPNKEHITLAYGRDFSDVSPINGVVTGGGAHTVNVAVDVKQIQDVGHSPEIDNA